MSAASSQLKRLAEVAKLRSPEARRTLLCGMADILLAHAQRLSLTELRHFDVIMSHAALQVDADIRRDIANRLADAPTAPQGLVAQLSHDEIDIAEQLLRRSQSLRDADLAAIIADHGPAHARAIAHRRVLSPMVTAALSKQSDEGALITLVKNRGAQFDLNAIQAIAAKARKLPALQEPLASRLDLPAIILTQLYFFAPAPLKREILKRADMLDPMLIDAAETATRRKLAAHFAREGDWKDDIERQFISDKIEAGAVNETLLRALLSEKRHTEFLFAFAYLIAVDLETARKIVDDNRFEALAIACRAASLERQTFAKIVFGLRQEEGDQPRALRILDLYIKIPAEAAERIMRFWRMGAGATADAARDRYDQDDAVQDLLELRDRAKGW
ncbi:DUF2336 domain-containing protein [Hyphococcus sp.]|uniref:DUF2336 domain-containing protein n=1 Tax=Hyphococcus sp. TaxID=2038636 RepID=UPI002082096A|nr:MAG: hypothetical protein DHS20C04_09820 [Marinicaulis sp.]